MRKTLWRILYQKFRIHSKTMTCFEAAHLTAKHYNNTKTLFALLYCAKHRRENNGNIR
jgi:hypothetical protein